ncbi:PLATZ transcription factor family protein [Wolffia australiana]
MAGLAANEGVPQWLDALMKDKFFNPCAAHATARKNERNVFCLDCCLTLCPHCLPSHPPHRLLQIRRYVYHDVVRVDELGKLIDCDLVQAYTTNSAKVVFISERPQTRPFRTSANVCITCDRSLQEPFIFCCLSCKVKYLTKTEGAMAKNLFRCDFLPLPNSSELDEDGQMTPDSVLDSAEGWPGAGESARKKRSGRPAVAGICAEAANRRKGVPCRSPLY